MARKKKQIVVGIAPPDGHTRITTSEDFKVFGGTQEVHEKVTEYATKISEKVKDRPVSMEEFKEIVDRVVRG